MPDTQPIETVSETAQAITSTPIKKAIGSGLAGPGRRKVVKTGNLDKPTEILEKRIETHRHKACTLADRLAEEIRATLDSTLPKKEKARLVRELTWSYGVLFDKASGGESSSTVKIQLPADILGALKIGIALQVAPKAQAIVVNPTEIHNTEGMSNSLTNCDAPVNLASSLASPS